jgi:hypothetical protein
MSPELERLLAALWERDNCEPRELPQWKSAVERLITDALGKQPGLTRDEFMLAIEPRYREFRRIRRHPPSMPPKA